MANKVALVDDCILIHTSVKLVTLRVPGAVAVDRILIHTSVKLVTSGAYTELSPLRGF